MNHAVMTGTPQNSDQQRNLQLSSSLLRPVSLSSGAHFEHFSGALFTGAITRALTLATHAYAGLRTPLPPRTPSVGQDR